jgi:hypothetical protein
MGSRVYGLPRARRRRPSDLRLPQSASQLFRAGTWGRPPKCIPLRRKSALAGAQQGPHGAREPQGNLPAVPAEHLIAPPSPGGSRRQPAPGAAVR